MEWHRVIQILVRDEGMKALCSFLEVSAPF